MSTTSKVTIIYKHVGSAPVLHAPKVTVNESEPFSKVINYLRGTKLNLTADTPLFVYLKSSFVPQPTEKVGTLADAFGYIDNGAKHLIVQYNITPTWG